MARGDGNLLFNPVKIKKKSPPEVFLSVVASGELLDPAYLLSADGLALQKDSDNTGGLFLRPFLGLEGEEQAQEALIHKGTDSAYEMSVGLGDGLMPTSLTPAGFLWSREDNLYFRPQDELEEEPYVYPLTLDGRIYSLFAGEDHLFFLWQEEETGIVYLSGVSRDSNSGAITGRDFNTRASEALLENKGDKAVLFLAGREEEDEISLMTMHPDGPGALYPVDPDADRVLMTMPPGEENHIAPGEEDGTYFYFDGEEGSLCFLDLAQGDNDIISHDADLADDDQLTEVLSLRTSGDKALLLKRGRLAIYTRDGLLDSLALGRDYEEMSVFQDKVLLWNQGENAYLEIDIAEKK